VIKKIVLLGSIVAAIAVVIAPGAQATQGIGGCTLDGTAVFGSPLKTNDPTSTGAPWNYSFDGTLGNCQGPSAKPSGHVSAGEPIVIAGTSYDNPYPGPTGTGGCANSDTAGTAVVVWSDNTVSAIGYTTKGAAAAVALMGTFKTGSLTLNSTAKDPTTGAPVSTKTVALVYGGDYTGGPLAFEPPDPTACSGAGVSKAGIQGFLGHGNYA
jgi:hypothetical protein